MAHDGYARAIAPVHTPGDGDTIFALATGTWNGEPNHGTIGSLAAEAMADAIVRAAHAGGEAPQGVPSAAELGDDSGAPASLVRGLQSASCVRSVSCFWPRCPRTSCPERARCRCTDRRASRRT